MSERVAEHGAITGAECGLSHSLVGRVTEAERLGGLVESMPSSSQVLVMIGDPGAGKSILLDGTARRARAAGHQVLTATGSETEAYLAFAGLHQILRPAMAAAESLPVRQRAALLGAFALEPAPDIPDMMLLGVAVLTLLSDLADREPLLVVVDDAQWIDRASLDVLAFVARRLAVEPVTLLLAVRSGDPFPGLKEHPTLMLDPLDEAAANRLLDAGQPQLPNGRMRWQILDQAAGNPLALLELAGAATRGGKLPSGAAAGPLPLTERLERIYAAHLDELPEATERALVLLAAADAADPATAVFLGLPDLGDKAWLPAQQAGLVRQVDRQIRFRHPLIRSAVYHAVSFDARHDAHLRLAEALRAEPDRRAWHLAAATAHPDAEVAAALEQTADRARRRGGYAAAARTLERAAELAPEREERARLLVAAAGAAVFTGQLAWVDELTAQARSLTHDFALQMAASHQAARLMTLTMHHNVAYAALTRTALQLSTTAPETALDILGDAAVAHFYSGEESQRHEIQHILSIIAEDPPDTTLRAWVRALADPFDSAAGIAPELPAMIRQEKGTPDRLMILAITAWLLDETPLAVRTFDLAFDLWQTQGPLPNGLGCAAALAYLEHGRWAQARTVCADVASVAAVAGLEHAAACASAVEAMVCAQQGDAAQARMLADNALALIDPLESRSVSVYARRALGTVAAAEGDYGAAYEQLRMVFRADGAPLHYHASYAALAELAAAAARSGHIGEAAEIVERSAQQLGSSASARLKALVNRGRALLSDPEYAESCFQAALADTTLGQWPFERAQTLLDHAEWLRRRRRIAEARPGLTAALETFRRLGARPWIERAQAELRASGIDIADATPDALAELTPQQWQIIRLAARGLTNREIGEKLFVSPRTVGSHLYRTFPKLGITTRSQLRDVLEGTPPGDEAVT
ncbi:LuxR family transcriptional regulator [Arthrobacter sp. ISL-28]|uniref:helix-turn-helix transcriptional regulator n=1 Tax=Arthrobacter sp. ISL-28 TaxID=2819108 RepID=UPI001BE7595E|nr:LuxR family transcriptional regulator [Arthrobacter sp. ISL-28]MBT2523428.1 AAA family ATPase [Arthrobacter sp. ISL-28]